MTRALVPLGMRFLQIQGNGLQGTDGFFEAEDENKEKRKIVAKYNTPTEENQTDLREEKERQKVSKRIEDGRRLRSGWTRIISAPFAPGLFY